MIDRRAKGRAAEQSDGCWSIHGSVCAWPSVIGLLTSGAPAWAEAVLFLGDSFTFEAYSPVWRYQAGSVRALNGVGGVPALFKRFPDEVVLTMTVSHETAPDWDRRGRLDHRRSVIDGA